MTIEINLFVSFDKFINYQSLYLFRQIFIQIVKLMATQTKQNENQPEKEVKEEAEQKQIRRIAERGQMPTDKSELIQYLSERIKQAEDALGDTEQLLETQVKERQKLAKSLQQRNKQLNKLYEVDQKALPEKIKEKLNDILSETVTQKIESQQRLQQEKCKNYEYTQRYQQMKWEDNNNKAKINQQESKEKELAQDLSILEDENMKTEEEIKQFEKELAEITEKKQNLENKYLQMKVALDRMTDIKGVLNRFFGNEDLWDEKMQLKEQKIQRLPQPAKQMAPPSREKGKLTNSRLKPINKPLKNDDEDFWRADFKSKY